MKVGDLVSFVLGTSRAKGVIVSVADKSVRVKLDSSDETIYRHIEKHRVNKL